jgi:Rrf2 family protein
MKIPTMLRYGVRMVVTLAQKGGIMSTSGLATEMGVSPLYLRQLAPVLERAGIIEGFRGIKGGYRLKASPEDITLAEIIQAFDEDFSLLDCIKSSNSCDRSRDCTTRYLWKVLSDVIRYSLKNMTLGDLIEKGNKKNSGAMGWTEYTI